MSHSLDDLLSLVGKTAVVTGAAGHVGEMIVATLVELGAAVWLVDKDTDRLDAVVTELQTQWPKAVLEMLAVDLAEPASIEAIYSAVSKKTQSLDVLVNNAAFVGTSDLSGWAVEFKQQSPEVWDTVMQVNLTAPFALVQRLSELLSNSESASVINIGSIYGIVAPDLRLYKDLPMGNPAAYAASKAGLTQLTRWLAAALAPRIRVNAISPGGIWRDQPEAFCQRYTDKTLLGRMATETDLKGATVYLATKLSAYVTGQNLVVDGGFTIT